jgi:omega-6 fatty acid desaturase (delta-12 desaturase)
MLARFQTPILGRGLGQVATTLPPYLALVAAMYVGLSVSIWLTLALAVPAAGLVVRLFIIQHDCGHGSFFRSRRANDLLGWGCSVITMTPFSNWRRQHANHHAVWNNLDKRGAGSDIYSTCLTVLEYRALPRWRRVAYRAARHPLVAQLLIPPLVFLVLYRVPFDTPRGWRRERRGVHATNAALVAVLGGLALLLGIGPVLLVQLPIMVIAAIIGVWLFSVQHKFEDSLWARQTSWNATAASVHGSSYLALPRVLQWFTGNIGFHHLHHLAPRIPNYRLAECARDLPQLTAAATRLSLGQALRANGYALWDEARGRMVRFREA